MPVTVERLLDQPIIIVKFSGHITTDDVREVFTRNLNLFSTLNQAF